MALQNVNNNKSFHLMENIISYFIKGKFDICLQKLEVPSQQNISFRDGFIFANNKAVCQALVHLAQKNIDVNCLNEFLRIWNNCVGCGFPNDLIPVYIELVLIYNILCMSLYLIDRPIDSLENAWELFVTPLQETCNRIAAVTIPESVVSTSVEGVVHTLSLLQKNVINKYPLCSGISLDIITLALVFICRTATTDKYILILRFINSTLDDGQEYKALNSACKDLPEESKSLFLLGLHNSHCTYSQIDVNSSLQLISLLGNVCSVFHPDAFKCESLNSTSCLKWKSQWNYCRALHLFNGGNTNEALGLLLMDLPLVEDEEFHGRYCCLLGQIYSDLGEHMKAVDYLTKATKTITHVAAVHYFLGYEHGKMGLHDLMLRSYQNLLKVIKKGDMSLLTQRFSVNYQILRILHGSLNITKPEASYVLAVAYAVNERFEEAMKLFNKLMTPDYYSSLINSHSSNSRIIVTIPRIVVILHEAATVLLLNGNLTRAEEVCRQAIGSYIPSDRADQNLISTDAHGTKDSDWLKKFLTQELNNVKVKSTRTTYFENYISFFDEDVIGLMLLAEIHKIQQLEEARMTLNQTLLLLSKHIARMQKLTTIADDELSKLSLVKALAGKICLHIAKAQEKTKTFLEVDKMYKRALSCNNGDKDVIYNYAIFLLHESKRDDAAKLWKTFFGKDSIINIEECQSLALRYLLRMDVTRTQLLDLEVQLLENR